MTKVDINENDILLYNKFLNEFIKKACEYTEVDIKNLKSSNRYKSEVIARKYICYSLYYYTPLTLNNIKVIFHNDYDHTSVINLREKLGDEISRYAEDEEKYKIFFEENKDLLLNISKFYRKTNYKNVGRRKE